MVKFPGTQFAWRRHLPPGGARGVRAHGGCELVLSPEQPEVGPPWVISVWVSLRSCLCSHPSLPKQTPRVALGRVVPLVDPFMIRALFMSGICSVRSRQRGLDPRQKSFPLRAAEARGVGFRLCSGVLCSPLKSDVISHFPTASPALSSPEPVPYLLAKCSDFFLLAGRSFPVFFLCLSCLRSNSFTFPFSPNPTPEDPR